MHRVLDIDLDFFHAPSRALGRRRRPATPRRRVRELERRGDAGVPPRTLRGEREAARMGLEYHDEAFARWRDAIGAGLLVPPFHVTHIDAHADLGFPVDGLRQFITDVMHRLVHERSAPDVVEPGISSGN